jgi:hypothetical protein
MDTIRRLANEMDQLRGGNLKPSHVQSSPPPDIEQLHAEGRLDGGGAGYLVKMKARRQPSQRLVDTVTASYSHTAQVTRSRR